MRWPIAPARRLRSPVAFLLVLLLGAILAPGTLAAPPLRHDGASRGAPAAATAPDSATETAAPKPARTGAWDGAAASESPSDHVRRKPAPRSSTPRSRAADPPTRADAGEDGEPRGREELRLDDPVLRWLPEILDAAEATQTPPSLIAAVIRVESSGDPNAVSPAGARGLMQIMPSELRARHIPASRWHHPATNILTGARILAERKEATGSWQGAVARYFGAGCDVLGTCTDVYVRRVFVAARHYAPIIRDPERADLDRLSADWEPPAIEPVAATPPPVADTSSTAEAGAESRRTRLPTAERPRAAGDRPDAPDDESAPGKEGEDARGERGNSDDNQPDASGERTAESNRGEAVDERSDNAADRRDEREPRKGRAEERRPPDEQSNDADGRSAEPQNDDEPQADRGSDRRANERDTDGDDQDGPSEDRRDDRNGPRKERG